MIEEIGRGGMGVVYKARQAKLNRLVAIKLMALGQLAGEQAKQRVRNEAQAAAQLQHPNIVAVYDVGEYEGAPFICMEYVEGENLERAARERSFKATEVAELVRALAVAAHYAHQQGVIHRDLKPSNVMIDLAGRARIMDFGLARHLDSDASLTISGQALGTPSFMSPEQAGGKRGLIGPATDVYCLGGILYFLLSGRPPFVADSRERVLFQVLRAEPVALRRLNASIPRDLQTICLKCLDKNPSRRYATAGDLADDLGRFLGREPIRARPAHLGTRVWRWCQRQPVAASLLGGLLLVSAAAVVSLLVGFLVAVTQWQRAEQSAVERERQRGIAEQSAIEQKRLRGIAEEAMRNLEQTAASSYQTAGVFRFKVPQGFAAMTGERLGVLKRAMLKNLSVQESEAEIVGKLEFFKGRMKEGMQDYARRSGLAPTDENGEEIISFYESPGAAARFGFGVTTHSRPRTFEAMERAAKEHVRWLIENEHLDEGSITARSGLQFGGRPTLVVDMAQPPRTSRSYMVYIQEQPQRTYILWIHQFSDNVDEEWIKNFLESVEIVLPQVPTSAASEGRATPGAEAALQRGVQLYQSGRLDSAREAYAEAEGLGHPDATFYMGDLVEEMGDLRKAEEIFKRGDGGGDSRCSHRLGSLLEKRGDVKGAEVAFKRAEARGDAVGAFRLARLYEKGGDLDAAIAAYKRAEALGDKDAALNLGLVLAEKRKDIVGAEAAWRRGVQVGNASAAVNLGLLLHQRGDNRGAAELFERAKSLATTVELQEKAHVLWLRMKSDLGEPVEP